jgi:hypothetical protein
MVWAFAEDERTVKVKQNEIKTEIEIEIENKIGVNDEVEEKSTGLYFFIVMISAITAINDIKKRSRVHHDHSSTRICTATW